MKLTNLSSLLFATSANHTIAQIPGGAINSPEAAASVGTRLYPAVILLPPGNVTASYDSFGTEPRTTPSMMTDAIDWAIANAGKANYSHLDASRIGNAGQSFGGLEAYSAGTDSRVSVYGTFNSGGNMTGTVSGLGGEGDCEAGVLFFWAGRLMLLILMEQRIMFLCQRELLLGKETVGHGGTYNEVNGGKIGVAASYLFQWILRGNETASQWFRNSSMASADGWSVASKDLDKISVTPI